MFKMTREVKVSMLVFLKLFKTEGLARYTGENMLVVSTELLGICRLLASADASLEEHVHGTLTGLGMCGNNRFMEMLRLLAQTTDLSSVLIVMSHISSDATPLSRATNTAASRAHMMSSKRIKSLGTSNLSKQLSGKGLNRNSPSKVRTCDKTTYIQLCMRDQDTTINLSFDMPSSL